MAPPSTTATRSAVMALARAHGLPRLTVRRLERLLFNDDTSINSSSSCIARITIPDVVRYCHHLARAGERVWNLRAYEHLAALEDQLLPAAESAEQRRRDGARRSRLDGFPVSLKANLAVQEHQLTAGSRILTVTSQSSNSVTCSVGVGGSYDSTVAQSLLRSSGALWMGSTTLDEFGMGSLGTYLMEQNEVHGNEVAETDTTASARATSTRNPFPLLHPPQQHEYIWSDQDVAQLLKLPQEAIFEIHQHLQNTFDNNQNKNNVANTSTNYDYATGGSSSGSAASVAHGSSLVSLGSDTGGSVRLPAAWCQLVGVKPTYGLLSRHGLVAYASSLDCVGVLAPSVHCAAVALDCLMEDSKPPKSQSESQSQQHTTITDSTQTQPTNEFVRDLRNVAMESSHSTCRDDKNSEKPLNGVRIGLPAAFAVAECSPTVHQAWSDAAQYLRQVGGATIGIVSTDDIAPQVIQQSLAAYYILACAEASSNLARYDGFRYGAATNHVDLERILDLAENDNQNNNTTFSVLEHQYAAQRTRGFGREVQRRVLLGSAVLSSDRFHTHYEAAAKVRSVLTHQLHRVLSSSQDNKNAFDLLLLPTCVSPGPPKIPRNNSNGNGDNEQDVPLMDATEMLANDVMTVPISLAGLPAISVPFGESTSSTGSTTVFRPGLQLVAGRHGEATMLRAAAVLEEAAVLNEDRW